MPRVFLRQGEDGNHYMIDAWGLGAPSVEAGHYYGAVQD